MDIKALNAAQRYAAARPATEPVSGATNPGEALLGLTQDFETTLRESEEISKAAMIGKADPHALVEALVQAELAVETVVTVRDKVVEAYQEILRMPV
ncbi:MAG: flagellar hook-basal body complex protein FliE [Pseudooceanicola sp.]